MVRRISLGERTSLECKIYDEGVLVETATSAKKITFFVQSPKLDSGILEVPGEAFHDHERNGTVKSREIHFDVEGTWKYLVEVSLVDRRELLTKTKNIYVFNYRHDAGLHKIKGVAQICPDCKTENTGKLSKCFHCKADLTLPPVEKIDEEKRTCGECDAFEDAGRGVGMCAEKGTFTIDSLDASDCEPWTEKKDG